jgi:hypothetical protein
MYQFSTNLPNTIEIYLVRLVCYNTRYIPLYPDTSYLLRYLYNTLTILVHYYLPYPTYRLIPITDDTDNTDKMLINVNKR